MINNFNEKNCFSLKKKGSKEQCPHKRNDDSYLCGIHKRSKIINYFVNMDNYLSLNNEKEEIKLNKTLTYYIKEELLEIYKRNFFINPLIFNERNSEELMNNININDLKVKKLRNTLKHYSLLKIIKKNQSKKLIFNSLLNYLEWEEYYLKNLEKIIKIQSYIKFYFIKKRLNSVNNVECVQFNNIFEIPLLYYYKLKENNKNYSFDIRTLYNLFQDNNFTNPYTLNPLDDVKIKEINNRIEYLREKGKLDDYEKKKVDNNIEVEFTAIEIFREIDLLGNYTNYKWFMDLNIYKLKELYYRSEDMMNYRININSMDERKKYFENGKIFPLKMGSINNINNINNLRMIILNEYQKIIEYDNDIENKKTAIMWLLIALTEVSQDAKIALPYLNMDLYG